MKLINKKQQKNILLMLAANYIIAKDALDRLGATTEMSVEEYHDAVEHLIDNTCGIAKGVAGIEGMLTVLDMINSKIRIR